MRVLLTTSYQLEFDPQQLRILEPYPPLGTLYAAACLRARGHEVALSDPMLARGHAEFESDLERFRPDLVAIYEDNFNYLSKMCLTNMRKAAFEKTALARARGARVAVNGSDATDRLEDYFAAGADFAILGEGERTLEELAQALAEAAPDDALAAIDGLAYRGGSSGLVRNRPRDFIRNLDELTFPAWDLVDVERYRRAWLSRHDRFSVNMVTTRGCPYHCNWCAKPIYGQRYNLRSPESVAAELAWLKKTVRPDHVWFADDIFGLRPGWVERFAQVVEELGCATPYKIQARVDLLQPTVVDALSRSGCESVWVGAESGAQKILDAMEKGTTVEQIRQATERLRARGIRVCYFLQFGYPGEGWREIQETRRLVRECRPDDIGISVSYPLPGTPFYERVRAELGEKTNWEHSKDFDLMFRGAYSPDFYRILYRLVHHEFRLRRELQRVPRPRGLARIVWNGLAWLAFRFRLMRLARSGNPALAST
jgi:anaerobic magnesium-protoporphyrin IX monomethyl ester cyclase